MTNLSRMTIAYLWKKGDYLEASFLFKNQLQSFISNPNLYKKEVHNGFFKSPYYFAEFNKSTEFVYACITIFNEVNIAFASRSKTTDLALLFLYEFLVSTELRMCLSSSIDLAYLNSLRSNLLTLYVEMSNLDKFKRTLITNARKRYAILVYNLGENHEVNIAISQISFRSDQEGDAFILFIACSSQEALGWVRNHNVTPIHLKGNIGEMRDQILELNLDLLIYGSDLTCFVRKFTFLAHLRLANIQIANQSSASSTQINQIDYFLMGECFYNKNIQEVFSEKILKFKDLGFRYNDYNYREKKVVLNNKIMNLRNRKKTFIATGANIYKITRECIDIWMKILLSTANTVILIAPFNRSIPADEKNMFCNYILKLCAEYNVEQSRMRILDNLGSRFNFQKLLIECDVLIDSCFFSSGNAFIDAFETFTPGFPLGSLQLRSQFSSGIDYYFSNRMPNLLSTEKYIQEVSSCATNKDWILSQNYSISERFSYDSLYKIDTMVEWKHLVNF